MLKSGQVLDYGRLAMSLILQIKSRIDKLLGLLCGYMLLVSAFIIIFSIVSRIFGKNAAWVEEYVRFAVIWTAFLGAYVATSYGEDIKVGMFDNFMSPKVKTITGIFIEIVVSIFLVLFFPLSVQYVIRFAPYKLAMTGIPLWLHYLCFPVGSFMMLLHSILTLIKHVSDLIGMAKITKETRSDTL